MGFQSYHNTESKEHNIETNKKSMQKTSNVEKLSEDTTKAQYWRHRGSGKPVGTNSIKGS